MAEELPFGEGATTFVLWLELPILEGYNENLC